MIELMNGKRPFPSFEFTNSCTLAFWRASAGKQFMVADGDSPANRAVHRRGDRRQSSTMLVVTTTTAALETTTPAVEMIAAALHS